MVSKYSRSVVRCGASDLIVVLALIAVAIPVAFAIQGWLTSQIGRVSMYSVAPTLIANIVSMEYRNNDTVVLISLTNNGSSDMNISTGINVTAILEDGTIRVAQVSRLTNKPTLKPGDEEVLVIRLTGVSSKVDTLVIEVRDVAGNSYLAKINVR